MKGAIFYRGWWLMPNSTAHILHGLGHFEKLDRHLREVQERARKLEAQ